MRSRISPALGSLVLATGIIVSCTKGGGGGGSSPANSSSSASGGSATPTFPSDLGGFCTQLNASALQSNQSTTHGFSGCWKQVKFTAKTSSGSDVSLLSTNFNFTSDATPTGTPPTSPSGVNNMSAEGALILNTLDDNNTGYSVCTGLYNQTNLASSNLLFTEGVVPLSAFLSKFNMALGDINTIIIRPLNDNSGVFTLTRTNDVSLLNYLNTLQTSDTPAYTAFSNTVDAAKNYVAQCKLAPVGAGTASSTQRSTALNKTPFTMLSDFISKTSENLKEHSSKN